MDVDNFLEEPNTLMDLIHMEKVIIAPVLESSSMYSNFWDGMNEHVRFVLLHSFLCSAYQGPLHHYHGNQIMVTLMFGNSNTTFQNIYFT